MPLSTSLAYNPFNPSTSLTSDPVRSQDTRSDPGAPTDQSLAPPTMPARADSRPDFMRGFGLNVPEETEEESEQEEGLEVEQAGQNEDPPESHEEEVALAEASHVALPGSDDTMDMELDIDEADAEVGSITTAAAHSQVHSRHVSRLSAALSLRSVSGHVSDTELEAEYHSPSEREGEPEDDAIGEWTGSEDLRTGTEATEDEVRKFPRCVVSTRPWIRADNLSDHDCLRFLFPFPRCLCTLTFKPSISLSHIIFFLPRRSHSGEHWRVVKPI